MQPKLYGPAKEPSNFSTIHSDAQEAIIRHLDMRSLTRLIQVSKGYQIAVSNLIVHILKQSFPGLLETVQTPQEKWTAFFLAQHMRPLFQTIQKPLTLSPTHSTQFKISPALRKSLEKFSLEQQCQMIELLTSVPQHLSWLPFFTVFLPLFAELPPGQRKNAAVILIKIMAGKLDIDGEGLSQAEISTHTESLFKALFYLCQPSLEIENINLLEAIIKVLPVDQQLNFVKSISQEYRIKPRIFNKFGMIFQNRPDEYIELATFVSQDPNLDGDVLQSSLFSPFGDPYLKENPAKFLELAKCLCKDPRLSRSHLMQTANYLETYPEQYISFVSHICKDDRLTAKDLVYICSVLNEYPKETQCTTAITKISDDLRHQMSIDSDPFKKYVNQFIRTIKQDSSKLDSSIETLLKEPWLDGEKLSFIALTIRGQLPEQFLSTAIKISSSPLLEGEELGNFTDALEHDPEQLFVLASHIHADPRLTQQHLRNIILTFSNGDDFHYGMEFLKIVWTDPKLVSVVGELLLDQLTEEQCLDLKEYCGEKRLPQFGYNTIEEFYGLYAALSY